jgi:hypothetical protein
MPPPPSPQLEGPDLSWYRITSRDTNAEPDARTRANLAAQQRAMNANPFAVPSPATKAADQGLPPTATEEAALNHFGVAEWRDTAVLPRLARDALEKASGITVPNSQFVLRVILAYVIAVVPLNWLIFRLLLNRREWAWIVVPLLALGFAVGVERVAAYDMGYDSACDEVDLLEVHEGYARGHLSRFAALYTTGRAKYSIANPDEPSAVALPFNTERSIGGEDITTAVWQSSPVPVLRNFSVQPRSLAMFRGEQMLGLAGPIVLEQKDGGRSVVNRSGFDLRDAVLVEFPGKGQRREVYVGTIAQGATVELAKVESGPVPDRVEGIDGPNPATLLTTLRHSWEDRPENSGELRLVAWAPGPIGGQTFEPALDRHRGTILVLVHLRYDGPPPPDGERFNARVPRQ